MENASKALLIAGGVLIAIIILTVGVQLYSSYKERAEQYNLQATTTEIQKFNSKFEVYYNRTDITAYEVLSVYNLAKEGPGPTGKTVTVIPTINDATDFIIDNSQEEYKCSSIVYKNGQVEKIIFNR